MAKRNILNTKKVLRDKKTSDVSRHFRVSILTVLKWRQKGCPHDTVPIPGENSTRKQMQYNFAELKKWHKENVRVGRPANG